MKKTFIKNDPLYNYFGSGFLYTAVAYPRYRRGYAPDAIRDTSISFACAVAYGFRLGFDFIFPVIAMILFAPTIFIYYNSSAWPYVIAYGVIAFVGMVIGRIFHKK